MEASNARVHGVGREFFAEENQLARTEFEQMGGRQIAGPAIIDADQIVRRALRIRQVAAIKQHERESARDRAPAQCGDWLHLYRW